MAEHTIPGSHKGLLIAILQCLIMQADPEATFVDEKPEPDAAPAVREPGFD